ncbi:hypothetical protein GGR53DRAFT_524353 [Hypoxylon sp. FL1150]|nr:hypothetical protein GGR53DRAFT_524353 [Hypoxylon sp. FL1150]
MNRLPETNTGVVTSWIPITTAYPTQPNCPSLIWKYVPSTLAAWDPGYGIDVDTDVTCLPKPVTTWWLQNRFGPIEATILSIGPITCPQAYYTATVSKKDESSTFVACCPFNYSFAKVMAPGDTGQCTLEVAAGDIVTYATNSGGWKTTSSSVEQSTTVVAIPVNGWIFAATSTDSATASETANSNGCDAAVSQALANTGNSACAASQISAGAAAGIGVGVSVGLTGFMALGAALVMMYRNRKGANKRPPAAHIAEFTNSGGKDGMDARARVYPTYSPVPRETPRETPSLSEGPQFHQSYGRDVWEVSSSPCLPPSHSDASHANARTVPHGEMEGTAGTAYRPPDERTRRRMEIEGSPVQNTDARSMGSGITGTTRQDSDEEIRRRLELEGEFDRNVKVALTSPWLATARPIPPPSTSSGSQYHPPY